MSPNMDKNVKWFGSWAPEAYHKADKLNYLRFLKTIPPRSFEEDCRIPEVYEALDWLENESIRKAPFAYFRKALELTDPYERRDRLTVAFKAIVRGL